MASIIKIKRSGNTVSPEALASGELAYSWFNDTNKLYIGTGTETGGDAANIDVIGGKFFTDMLDHDKGTLTANSAIIVDANSKIDVINIDNITIDGNTISSTNTDGNVIIDPNRDGYVQIVGTNGLVIPVGTTAEQGPNVAGAIRYNSQNAQFEGYSGTNWSSLGGVRSVDGLTFIEAESAPGESDDTLYFYVGDDSTSGNKLAVTLDENTLRIYNTTAATENGDGALVVDGGVDIAGALVVGGSFVGEGSASFSEINGTPIGNVTPSTGAFTVVDVDNISIDGNTISSTDTNGDINITPNGNGKIVVGNLYIGEDSIEEYIQDVAGLQFVAGEGIDITYNDTDGTTTIDAEIATKDNLGVASFDTNDFDVVDGAVSIKTAGVSNAQLKNSSVTFGSTTVALGSTSTSIAGVTELTVDNLNINGNTITATNIDGSITLNPNGNGTVDVSGARVTNVGTPTQSSDGATKAYVDEVAQGLHAIPSAEVATTEDLNTTFNASNNTLTANVNGAIAVNGVTLSEGDNVLVKDQTNKWENGSYVVTETGDGLSPFVLTRCGFCNETDEIPGAFEFVTGGIEYANTGWVATVEDGFTLNATDGSGNIRWVQFSGAGTYTDGDGLVLNGTTFNVVGTENRISVTADAVNIADTYIGQTSITTLGKIETGTWEGTIVGPTYGGTGVDNGTSTIKIGGDLEFSGEFTTTFTVTNNTSVTLPTTGTLATLDGTETLTNKTIDESNIGDNNPGTAAFTTLAASDLVTFTNETEASDLSTAAVVITGGVSVNNDIRAGKNIIGTGAETSNIDGFTIDGGTY